MREILFRAKAVNRKEGHEYRTNYKNGDWVYGLLANNNPYSDFAEMTNTDGICGIEVDKNTIGQYTGLTDKNGEKIFEGDILGGFLDDEYPEYKTVVSVEWCENMWCARQGKNCPYLLEEDDMYYFEVIGNIHDNPELIGGAENG